MPWNSTLIHQSINQRFNCLLNFSPDQSINQQGVIALNISSATSRFLTMRKLFVIFFPEINWCIMEYVCGLSEILHCYPLSCSNWCMTWSQRLPATGSTWKQNLDFSLLVILARIWTRMNLFVFRSVLNVCMPYTSRDELSHAIRELAVKTAAGEIEPRYRNSFDIF